MKFKTVNFIQSAGKENLPFFANLLEIAVAGRSNVGKSSLLNHLFGVKNLVKTSSTPGKTRTLNFFKIDDKIVFVDMPGYGYANVAKTEKKVWAETIDLYLNSRDTLKVLLLLIDIRREPSEEDLQMLQWILYKKVKAIVILNKVDKLSKNACASQTKKILSKLSSAFQGQELGEDNLEQLPYVHYSSVKNIGRKELIAILRDCLNDPA